MCYVLSTMCYALALTMRQTLSALCATRRRYAPGATRLERHCVRYAQALRARRYAPGVEQLTLSAAQGKVCRPAAPSVLRGSDFEYNCTLHRNHTYK